MWPAKETHRRRGLPAAGIAVQGAIATATAAAAAAGESALALQIRACLAAQLDAVHLRVALRFQWSLVLLMGVAVRAGLIVAVLLSNRQLVMEFVHVQGMLLAGLVHRRLLLSALQRVRGCAELRRGPLRRGGGLFWWAGVGSRGTEHVLGSGALASARLEHGRRLGGVARAERLRLSGGRAS